MRRLLWLLVFAFTPVYGGTIDKIRAKGEIVIAVKADYAPYGFRSSSGVIVGVEPDLAADLAKRLGVRLRMAPVLSANRISMLREGKADVVIATLSITDERKRQVRFVDPPYYASGAGLFVKKALNVEQLSDLSDHKVCGIEGNVFLGPLSKLAPDAKAVLFPNVPAAEAGLLSGACDALLFDDTFLLYEKSQQPSRFRDFEFISVSDVEPLLWGIATPLGDRSGDLAQFISKTIVDWHRSGLLLDVEKRWLGGNTFLLTVFNKQWSQQ